MLRVLTYATLICAALPAFAGSKLEVMDTRGDMLGWEAVGRIDVAGHGFCTGVLIAPDQVLTAAHCLFDRNSGEAVAADRVVFRSGYLKGDALSERRGAKFVVADGYVPGGNMHDIENVTRDVAILRLQSPISSSEADPFRIAETGGTGTVQVMSYGRGRTEAMSWQRRCDLTRESGALKLFDCDITFGSSGAPVFVKTGSRVRIFSLVSGTAMLNDGSKIGVGMALPRVVSELRAKLRNGDAPTAKVSTGARRIKIGGGKSESGAKFIRAN